MILIVAIPAELRSANRTVLILIAIFLLKGDIVRMPVMKILFMKTLGKEIDKMKAKFFRILIQNLVLLVLLKI
jgi:hypothetical protein